MKNKIILALVLITVFFVGAWTFQAPKTQWEFKVEKGIDEKKFNELGTQGWEIASCGSYAGVMGGGFPYCVFKRAKQ